MTIQVLRVGTLNAEDFLLWPTLLSESAASADQRGGSDPYRAEIIAWLDAKPVLTAVDVLTRLMALQPGRFTENHIRTIQRMVEFWRADQAARPYDPDLR